MKYHDLLSVTLWFGELNLGDIDKEERVPAEIRETLKRVRETILPPYLESDDTLCRGKVRIGLSLIEINLRCLEADDSIEEDDPIPMKTRRRWLFVPGYLLIDWVAARGIDVKEIAERLGIRGAPADVARELISAGRSYRIVREVFESERAFMERELFLVFYGDDALVVERSLVEEYGSDDDDYMDDDYIDDDYIDDYDDDDDDGECSYDYHVYVDEEEEEESEEPWWAIEVERTEDWRIWRIKASDARRALWATSVELATADAQQQP